jgi:hypothetical protein
MSMLSMPWARTAGRNPKTAKLASDDGADVAIGFIKALFLPCLLYQLHCDPDLERA